MLRGMGILGLSGERVRENLFIYCWGLDSLF